MKRMSFLRIASLLAFVVAACSPAATATQIPVPVSGNTALPPAIVITETLPVVEATATTAAMVESPSGETTSTAAPETQRDTSIRISATTSTGVREPFLVDQTGRTIYLYTQDTPDSGTSACTDTCATTWLPVSVTGVPTAGSGVNSRMLGVIPRSDDKMQATYNGWPLYYYSGDRTIGAKNGQGLDNSWFLVSAAGNAIGQ